MLRIGSKKDGIQYKKRICAYAIIERIKDKKLLLLLTNLIFIFF